MFDLEKKWLNKIEQTGSTLGLSEIQTMCMISYVHRQGASLSPLIYSRGQLQLKILHHPQPQSTAGVETPPKGPGKLRWIQNIHYTAYSPITCITGSTQD